MSADTASVAELAQILGISEVAVLKRIKRGTVDATKVGRKWHIPRSEVERLQGDHPNPSEPNPDANRPNLSLTVMKARESARKQDIHALTSENDVLRGKLDASELAHDATRRELDAVRDASRREAQEVDHLRALSTDQSESIRSLTEEVKGLTAMLHTRPALPRPVGWFARLLGRANWAPTI